MQQVGYLQRLRNLSANVAPQPPRIATLRSFHRGSRSKMIDTGIYTDNVLAAFRVMASKPSTDIFVLVAAENDKRCLVRLDANSGFSYIDGIASDTVLKKIAETEPGRDFFMHNLRVQVLTPADIRHAICKMPVWYMRQAGDYQVNEFCADIPLSAKMLKRSFFADYSEAPEQETEPAESPYRR